MSLLYVGLYGHRQSMPTDEWLRFCERARREHAVWQVVYQSPVTKRAFDKPRGYAGDAALIDLIYGHGDLPADVTEVGRQVLRWELETPGIRSARNRRSFLASLIDLVAIERPRARVFSIACGHVREFELSTAAKRGSLGEFVCLDQDAESLAEVTSDYGELVTTVHSSVKRLMVSPDQHGTFDLVYAAGLFDYLPNAIGRALLNVMWRMLRPGGRLLVANWADDVLDIGYMEAFMDWRLIWRSDSLVQALAADIPAHEIAHQRLHRDPAAGCIFLELERR